jgi:hypothetical protein
MFEHLGWMIMAKEHNSELKIKAYMDSIQRFVGCAEKKIKDTRDEDRKDDLAILHLRTFKTPILIYEI